MKFIFVKNLKNKNIWNKIFEHLQTSNYRNRPGSKSFIKDFKNELIYVNQDEEFVWEFEKNVWIKLISDEIF